MKLRSLRVALIRLQIVLYHNKFMRSLRAKVSAFILVMYILQKYTRKGWFRESPQEACHRIQELHKRWVRQQMRALNIRKIKIFHERERLEAEKARLKQWS